MPCGGYGGQFFTRSLEDLDIEFIFEQLDLMTDTRLRRVQFFGRGRHVQVVAHNRIEKAKLLKFQGFRRFSRSKNESLQGTGRMTTCFWSEPSVARLAIFAEIYRFYARRYIDFVEHDIGV